MVDDGADLGDDFVADGELRLRGAPPGRPRLFSTAFVARMPPPPYSASNRRITALNALIIPGTSPASKASTTRRT